MLSIRTALAGLAAIAFLAPAILAKFPIMAPLKPKPLVNEVRPDASLPTFRKIGSDPESQKFLAREKVRQKELDDAIERGERDTTLNQMRHETISAASNYLPCDAARKRRFILAAQKYYDELGARSKCVASNCAPDARAKYAEFRTDLDWEVGKAVTNAVSRGGITAWDFRLGSWGARVVEAMGSKTVSCSTSQGRR